MEVRCELKTGVLGLGWIIFQGPQSSAGTVVALWLSGDQRWKLESGPGFPSRQGPGGYGSVWEGCWRPWVCGLATQAGLLPAGIQRRAWRPGAAPGRGGEAGYLGHPTPPRRALLPRDSQTSFLLVAVSRCVASLGLKRLAAFLPS